MESALFAHRPSMFLRVKAKNEKHRTRGRARFGRKAMVLRLKGTQRRKKDRSVSISIDTMHRDVYAFAYTASLQSDCIKPFFALNYESNIENTPQRL